MRSSRGVIETEEWRRAGNDDQREWELGCEGRCAVGSGGHTPAVNVTCECVSPVLSKSPCESQRETGCLLVGKEMDWLE